MDHVWNHVAHHRWYKCWGQQNAVETHTTSLLMQQLACLQIVREDLMYPTKPQLGDSGGHPYIFYNEHDHFPEQGQYFNVFLILTVACVWFPRNCSGFWSLHVCTDCGWAFPRWSTEMPRGTRCRTLATFHVYYEYRTLTQVAAETGNTLPIFGPRFGTMIAGVSLL